MSFRRRLDDLIQRLHESRLQVHAVHLTQVDEDALCGEMIEVLDAGDTVALKGSLKDGTAVYRGIPRRVTPAAKSYVIYDGGRVIID